MFLTCSTFFNNVSRSMPSLMHPPKVSSASPFNDDHVSSSKEHTAAGRRNIMKNSVTNFPSILHGSVFQKSLKVA